MECIHQFAFVCFVLFIWINFLCFSQDIFKQATEDRLTSANELPYFEGDFWPNVLEESIKELEQEEEERKKEENTAACETPEVSVSWFIRIYSLLPTCWLLLVVRATLPYKAFRTYILFIYLHICTTHF